MCQAPPKALSHTLKHCSFTSPAEEGSLVHCQGSKKANESQLGLCGDRGDPGLAHEHALFEKEHYPPRCSLSGRDGLSTYISKSQGPVDAVLCSAAMAGLFLSLSSPSNVGIR